MVGIDHKERTRSIDARADCEPVARDDPVEVLPSLKCLERVALSLHVHIVYESVRALDVAVRDVARAVPVVEKSNRIDCRLLIINYGECQANPFLRR